MALAGAARVLYRHRSAFWPFLVTVAAFVLAAIIHAHHADWWPTAAVVTAAAGMVAGMPRRLAWAHPAVNLTAGIITRAWEACGIARTPERVYVTVVIVTAGGWLTAAIAVGPAAKPLPAVAAIATVILGIPWWAHRRRRARVRIERTVHMWPGMAENMGLPGSRIATATGNEWGFTARVVLRKGTTAAHAISQVPAIESGLGVRPGSVRALPDPARADRVIIRVIENDPHAAPAGWPGQPGATITRPVEIGLFEDGRPVRAVILRRNLLIGGIMGSGKSGIVNVILAFLAACADVTVWGIDLKGGMELQPWAACLARLATTSAAAAELMRDAVTEVDRRAAFLAGKGARTWHPGPGHRALVIVADEYAEMPPEALGDADSVARRGRAVAVNLIAATQRPTQQAMGGNAVRSQMDVRICLRVREKRDTDLILGQGAHAAGWDAHALTRPGEFLISAPEFTIPERARGYLITDAQVARHAARHPATAPGPAGPPPPPAAPRWPHSGPAGPARPDGRQRPRSPVLDALRAAGPGGAAAGELLAATGLPRATLHRHLAALAAAGLAEQAGRGRWRAATPAGPPGGHAG
jgi:S-DNA-T family DNA segregation ATPase FtsK/SpoIIIE